MTEVFLCDDFELAALGGCLKGRNGLCSNTKRKNCPYFKEKNMEKQDSQTGIRVKYDVKKVETGETVNNCFVLRPDKDPAAVAALRTYALVTPNKALANDIMAWVGAKPADKPRLAETGDAVNHPAHYTQGGIECIEALKAATAGLEGIEAVCTANAIKYLWRWKHKGGVQDLDKAIWYIKRLKEEMERSERDE